MLHKVAHNSFTTNDTFHARSLSDLCYFINFILLIFVSSFMHMHDVVNAQCNSYFATLLARLICFQHFLKLDPRRVHLLQCVAEITFNNALFLAMLVTWLWACWLVQAEIS